MNTHKLIHELQVLALRCSDGYDRNGLPTDQSPYKTRGELAGRNREHYLSLHKQVTELLAEVAKPLPPTCDPADITDFLTTELAKGECVVMVNGVEWLVQP
jgi:hypothetical protein